MSSKKNLRALRGDSVAEASVALKSISKELTIRVCVGTGGLAAGSKEVMNAFNRQLRSRGIAASVVKKCVKKTGCHGLCSKDVLVDVIRDGKTTTYQFITPEKVRRIVDEHVIEGRPVREWFVGPEYYKFYNKEKKILLKHIGDIDPESINEYIHVGGYRAARKALSRKPSSIITVIKNSGLRGRGGAGFPTGLKWEACSREEGTPKYLICNADEGDPGAFMDCAIIEGSPHSLIEGMIIAAYAIGVNKAYIYIRAEYPVALQRLKIALKQARQNRYLGRNIFQSGFSFDIRVKEGAGAFVCGEETALMSSIEGKRGMPRSKPPFPAQKGLWGMPTVINNVETLATVPLIVGKGAKWYSSIGTELSKGTKIFSITGKVRNTGLIEVPMGITLREIVFDIGGGCPGGNELKAVQTGGPSGGCIPASHIDMPLDYESLKSVGSMMGSGGMIVMDSTTCMVDMAKFFLEFTQNESCGKCLPCRVGNKRLYERLKDITEGRGKKGDIEYLKSLGEDIKISSLCGLGQTAPNPVLSTIQWFRHEYEAHIYEGRCPAGVCEALRQYVVKAEVCKMCGKCFRECPSGAISWEKKHPASIDKGKCIQCGKCFEVCQFGAIA
jgi:NADH:ubiquinone oxidoreductase subunit F (NADH-binding)/(2Fe-2S) ferredoxin/Pyruvate/2-oxoacid:ferredoxin oxidoreductase delta subunit